MKTNFGQNYYFKSIELKHSFEVLSYLRNKLRGNAQNILVSENKGL